MTTALDTLPPSRPGRVGLGDYVSPSRLSLWLRCPLAFRLKYLDGVEVPTSPSLFLGQVVHKLLECYYRQRLQGVTPDAAEVTGQLPAIWAPLVEKARIPLESSSQEERLQGQAVDLASA